MLREMQTTYGRSPGGFIWAILEPAAGIALLSFIFSLGFRSPALGNAFPPFYATGLVPFLFFNDVSGKIAGSLTFSRQLLAYPSVTYMDALLARIFVNVFTQLLVGYIVFFGILFFYDTQGGLDLTRVGISYLMVIFLSVGVGTINCLLASRFPLWQRAWSILTRPLFLVSCIFFLFESIPEPYQNILWYNPLVHVIGMMRAGFYTNYDATYTSVGYVTGLSLVLTVVGLVFLRRYHRDILIR